MTNSGGSSRVPEKAAQPPAAVPVLRPTGRISQRRFTLLIAAALGVLILIRLLTTHPLPDASHSSSTGAVAGYLIGLEHKDVNEVRGYLAPDRKSEAAAVVKSLTSRRVYVTAPALSYVSQGPSQATITISAQICSPYQGTKEYTCDSIGDSQLGLPDELDCVKVNGEWYVTTLFEPS
jgi:hypothetical protein